VRGSLISVIQGSALYPANYIQVGLQFIQLHSHCGFCLLAWITQHRGSYIFATIFWPSLWFISSVSSCRLLRYCSLKCDYCTSFGWKMRTKHSWNDSSVKPNCSRENLPKWPLSIVQIPHGSWDWTQEFAVRSWWLTTWTMALLHSGHTLLAYFKMYEC
jgi:hypothetical protein